MPNSTQDKIRNLQETLNYLGLFSNQEIDEDFASIDLGKLLNKLPYKSPAFRTNLYSVTLVVDAYGKYTSDESSFEIHPNLLIFNNPGGLRQIEWYKIVKIHHYTFSEHFLLKHAGIHIYKMFPFLLLEAAVPKISNQNIYEELQQICQKIDLEYNGNSRFKKKLLANLLSRLLLKIKDTFWTTDQNYENPSIIKKNDSDILRIFIENLECHFEQIHTGKSNIQLRVKDFAIKQNLHENYFSHVIKEKSGKTANQWINEKTYFVAIRMVEDSSLSLKEISYCLGFQHASHFSAFFKKNSGISPADYRKTISKVS